MGDDIERFVSDQMAAFDRKDIDFLMGRFAPDAQNVDEIMRRWIRTREELETYARTVLPQVTDIRSVIGDLVTKDWGDTGLATFWLEQDYVYEGRPVHVSSPTTFVLRRIDGAWRIALIHTVPLPEDAQ